MKKKIFLGIGVLLLCLNHILGKETVGTEVSPLFDQGKTITVRPDTCEELLFNPSNPGKGWQLWGSGDHTTEGWLYGSLCHSTYRSADIEPAEEIYNFDGLNNTIPEVPKWVYDAQVPIMVSDNINSLTPNITIEPQNEIPIHPSSNKKKIMLPPPTIPEGFGVSVMWGGNKRDMDVITDLRFKVIRKDLEWGKIEIVKGIYDFKSPGYDEFVESSTRLGIQIIFILGSSNKLYEDKICIQTEHGRRAFGDFAKAAAERYSGKNIIWEIWNEPNFDTFWQSGNQPQFGIRPVTSNSKDAGDYCKLVETVSPVLRKADPTGIIAAPAISEIRLDRGWVEDCFKSGLLENIDVFSVHPYRVQPPETVLGDYAMLRLLMRDYGREIPIIQSEWGYSLINWDGSKLSSEMKAQFFVRMYLINLYAKIPICVWHTLYCFNNNNGREDKFGLLSAADYKSNISYQAAKTLMSTLKGYSVQKRLDTGLFTEEEYALKFTRGKYTAVAFWTTGKEHEITLPVEKGMGNLVDWIGVIKNVKWNNSGLRVRILHSPQYLLVKNE